MNRKLIQLTTTDPLYFTGEVGRRLGVGQQTVIHWEKTGRIAAINTASGVRLIPQSEIERIIRLREQEAE